MIETGLVAFTTFFATVGPADVAVIYAALAGGKPERERRALAAKGCLIAAAILLFFAVAGDALLRYLGISLPALRTAGGILLLLIGIDMVFARSSGGTSTTGEENEEAAGRDDLAVFPLATPLLAGPGAIGAMLLLMADTEGERLHQIAVVAAMLATLLLAFLLMLAAGRVQALLGKTGVHVIARVVGVLLAGLAVQFIFDGISASGLVG